MANFAPIALRNSKPAEEPGTEHTPKAEKAQKASKSVKRPPTVAIDAARLDGPLSVKSSGRTRLILTFADGYEVSLAPCNVKKEERTPLRDFVVQVLAKCFNQP